VRTKVHLTGFYPYGVICFRFAERSKAGGAVRGGAKHFDLLHFVQAAQGKGIKQRFCYFSKKNY
jgi:hypothetical protein